MLERLGQALAAADTTAVAQMMADDVTLRAAVHDEPFERRPAAAQIPGAVLDGVWRDIRAAERVPPAVHVRG